MSPDPALALKRQQQQQADCLDDGQPLAEALRTGDREAIEAIVHRLTDQLETLKMESRLAGMPRLTDAGGPLARVADDSQARRRLSSVPGIAAHHAPLARESADDLKLKNRRKRATMAPGLLGSEAPKVGLSCAYCGMSLDEGCEMATKASLSSEIGYCCSNCEHILSYAADGDNSSSLNVFTGTSTVGTGTPGAAAGQLQDGDGISLNAVTCGNDDNPHGYFEALAHQCDVCQSPLGEEYVNVLGRRFHVTHFTCEDCNIPLYALGGYLQDPNGASKFYCQRDYLQRFSPSCHACSVQITSGEMVVALGRTYHSDCFVCSICQSPFIGDVCYEHDSQPLCEWHWYIQNGLLCTECGGIIKNQCVLTRGKKYHQACAESKYGQSAITFDEARRQLKASGHSNGSSNNTSTTSKTGAATSTVS
ncbi:Transforming growth factor beta-1-induced transcript 1 protein [Coemansia sp. RSA 1722]|nr:Transforming growth factor beta-1-induced transcript 1 protein [Coemansia sp. RSA 486]KAJ2227513.1 Transforming growth factor beta-1-induced transcript 1 protein [Coemansia sp. RSA 485]KAJ2591880.1 Transforming growth factor beta-1-induced transcript 1 protein [Coemansia sp. RSA 1722]KAJ2600159.1 Transforming growth factor beta-1-induced transcript 1 protein [Coemansia sp. RSA 1721]KAJ2638230.1 Transforming growth factor beta-1-induced transcript 1 protein [Coemansia sp. RSA 1286]